MRFFGVLGAALLLLSGTSVLAQTPELTPAELKTALSVGGDKAPLVERLRTWYGADNLKRGANPKVNDLTVAWAIETAGLKAGEEPRVVSENGKFTLPLQRVGTSDIYTAVATLPEGEAFLWNYEVKGERSGNWRQIEVYTTPPELKPNDSVPKGTVTQMPEWRGQVFEGTVRNWWVYVPAQYTADKPAAVMVFQDGASVRNQIPIVFDNMIAKKEIPVTIGIFIDPGRRENPPGSNRSIEYDTLSDRYARFLTEEILPEVAKKYSLRTDAAGRAIAGVSSGGICAFTVAWEHPEAFSKVVTGVGSFVNLQGGPTGIGGGHNYPTLIRQSRGKTKPIRIFMTDGENDLDNPFGNWPLANQQVAKALAFSGYDYKFLYGKGFHGGRYFMATMPEALRWIWRDEVGK